jgi:hypothetical protein
MLLPLPESVVWLLNTTNFDPMKKILLFPLFCIFISCAPQVKPEETVNLILGYVERGDYGALENLAPLFSRLSASEKESVRESLMPFIAEKPFIEVKKQGFRQCSVLLHTRERESRIMVMTLNKIKGVWVLSDEISYTQKIGFIPAEK